MCGIFGVVGQDVHSPLLQRMANLSSHRGPDDLGFYTNPASGVAFGLRRLSIIDLAGGRQPVANEDETVWLACNGEIYNYVEIRRALVDKGHCFRTGSDVEVLVHLYEEQGLAFLDDVNGMFGLVLYDAVAHRLILARDRLGIKPLYYAWDGHVLVFASEIKPVLLAPSVSREPDWDAVSAYLKLLYVPAPRTGFAAVRKLDAGTMAVLEDDGLSVRPYWQLDRFVGARCELSLEDSAEQLAELLRDACRLQLRSDVPVGAFLSGGIDSSAVVAFASAHGPVGFDTYTVYWEGARNKLDERMYARAVAERYGNTHHEVQVTYDDFLALLPLLVWHLEEPNADGAFVPTAKISELARSRSKVVLTGAGGDEIFGGYDWYRPEGGLSDYIRTLVDSRARRSHGTLYSRRALLFPWTLVVAPFRPAAAYDALATRTPGPTRGDINAHMMTDVRSWLLDDILMLTDKMTMASSIEARVPLLDHRIVEFVAGLPAHFKRDVSDKKRVFKRAIGGALPPEILSRVKEGFGAPMHSFMQGPFREICLRLLEDGELMRAGILDRRSLRRLRLLASLRDGWAWSIWILLNLELWFRLVVRETKRPVGLGLDDL